MVDSVNVENVGGDAGIASELTLKRLLVTMELMARKTGANSEEAIRKAKEQYKKSIEDLDEATLRAAKAKEKNTKSTKKSTKALTFFAKVLQGLVVHTVGAAVQSLQGFAEAVINGDNSISQFAGQIPIIGSKLTLLTGYIDETFDAFKEMAMTGASFNNSLNEIRLTAARSRMNLEEFRSFVVSNSTALAGLAGSATKGAKAVASMTNELGGTRDQLLSMGFNFQEINEAMLDYASLTRSAGRLERRNTAQVAQSAAQYATTLQTLAKLTGKSVDQIREEQQAEQQSIALQIKLSQMSEKERSKAMAAMAEATQQGPTVAARMRELLLGLPPMTEATRTYAATMSQSNAELENTARAVADNNQDLATFNKNSGKRLSEMVATQLEAAREYGDALGASIEMGTGPLAQFGEIIQESGIDIAKYADLSGQALRDAIEKDVQAVQEETKKRDGTVSAMASFTSVLADVRHALHTAFVESGVLSAFTSTLEGITDAMREQDFVDGLREVFDQAASGIKSFLSIFERNPEKTFMENVENWWDTLIDKAGDLWTKYAPEIGNTIAEAISDMFADDSIVNAIASGISTIFSKIVDKLLGTGDPEAARTQDTPAGAGSKVAKPEAEGGGTSGFGKMLSGIGDTFESIGFGVGAVVGSLMLAGAAKVLVVKGGAAIGLAITAIGTGIAGASWITDGTLNNLINSLGNFLNVDAQKLSDLGNALVDFSAGLAAFAGAGVAQGIGGIASNVSGFFNWATGGDSAIDKIKQFGELELEIDKIKSNAEALNAFGSAFETLARNNVSDISFDSSIVTGLREFGRLPNGTFANAARGMEAIANIRGFESKLESMKGLDARNVDNYRRSLERLVDTLEDLNEQLQGGDTGMFGDKPETTAGDVFSQMNPKPNPNEVNTSDLLSVLKEIRDLNKRTLRAINEQSGNVHG